MGNLRWTRALLVAAAWGALATRDHAQEPAPPVEAEGIVAGLHASDIEARRAAANALRTADRDIRRQALPAMIDRLQNEKDGQVRLGVLDAVAALGPDAAPAIPALLQSLRTDAGGTRQEESHQDYRSALALAAVGKPAVEGLRGLLRERDRKESVRAEVIMALGRIGPDAAPAVPELVPLLGDRSERIRREASQALGRIGPSAVEPLIIAANDGAAERRARAIEALGGLATGDTRARRAVLARVDDPAPEVRAEAIRALARFEVADDRLRPILAERLRHPDARVRLAAVNVLAGRRPILAALAPDLEVLAASPDVGTSRHAAFLLGLMGRDALPRLIAALRRPESRIEVIAEAMGQVGRPAGTAIV
ncbi:MAG: HEAT repeat domain-containing protein, partial [Isosphaeraceae bacterium]